MKEFYRRHLPHWQPRSAVLFVTFRLKDSLPREVIEALKKEGKQEGPNHIEDRGYFDKWDAYLDRSEFGPHWLSQPEVADIVKEAMHFRDGIVFDLHAFCIMPNHVHVVFEPQSRSGCQPNSERSEYHSDLRDLATIMQSLKRHTARQANLILGRKGAFWQDESYDHAIRDSDEYIRTVNYVLENPVKGRLASEWAEWQWTYCKPDILK